MACGVLVVGIKGNNGTTFAASVLAQALDLTWRDPRGRKVHSKEAVAGSVLMAGSCFTHFDKTSGQEVYRPLREMLPPGVDAVDTWRVAGWDVRDESMVEATRAAGVLSPELIDQMDPGLNFTQVFKGHMLAGRETEFTSEAVTLDPDAIDLHSSGLSFVQGVEADIDKFRSDSGVSRVVVVWAGSTEAPTPVLRDVTDLDVMSPSQLYAVAALRSGCHFVNGGAQNTLCPALVQFAQARGCRWLGTTGRVGRRRSSLR